MDLFIILTNTEMMCERLSISNLESSVCVLNEWSEMTSEWLGKCNDQQSFRQFYVVGFISRQKTRMGEASSHRHYACD